MIVVADSSPLITLARAGHLGLLRDFYGTVTIPKEVQEEVTVGGAGQPGADEVSRASWIHVSSGPIEPPPLLVAAAGLGAGERGAICLASAIDADLVLIDESRARRVARNAGLQVAGSIAILEKAAQMGKLADLRFVYNDLLEQGIRFDRRLLDDSLGRLEMGKL